MKKSFLLYFLFLSLPFFCQIKLSHVPFAFKKNVAFHQLTTTVNPNNNEIYSFALDKENLFIATFSSSLFFKDSITIKKPLTLRYILGVSYPDNNSPFAYYATSDLSKVYAVAYNFNSRTTLIKEVALNLKNEVIYTEFAANGHFYFVTKGENDDSLQLIQLSGNQIQRHQLDFKPFSFAINTLSNPRIVTIFDEYGLTKMQEKGFNSFDDGSQKVKYYIENNKLRITLNHLPAHTLLYEIDLNTASIVQKIFKNGSLPNVKQSNSLFFENKLITIACNSEALEIQFIKYDDQSILTRYRIDATQSSPFSTPFYSVTGSNMPTNIKTTKKFISAIFNSDLSMSLYHFNGKYIASFGGLQHYVSSNELFFVQGAFPNLNSTTHSTQNILVDVALDSNFKEVTPIQEPLFIDKIARYSLENKNTKHEYYFPYKKFYILSYYDTSTKEIVLRKFTNGFDY